MGNKIVGGASCLEPQINRPQDKDFAFGGDPRSHWEEGRQGGVENKEHFVQQVPSS